MTEPKFARPKKKKRHTDTKQNLGKKEHKQNKILCFLSRQKTLHLNLSIKTLKTHKLSYIHYTQTWCLNCINFF